MPHSITTDRVIMAGRIRLSIFLLFQRTEDVFRSIGTNCYSSDYQRTKEVT